MLRFIHTADLHLDTPFKGLSQWNSELSKKLKDATFNAFKNIVNKCIELQVDFLVIAGDVFDSESKSLMAQLKFVKELERLNSVNIPVYLICGNHDPLSSWLPSLSLPENVVRFDSKKPTKVTFVKNGIALADIYGISFQRKVVSENLSIKYKIEEPSAPFSIAILHGSLGSNDKHETYAPFTLNDIIRLNFHYWALGHIHKAWIVKDENPTVLYPGNPQGRDFGEQGSKGCFLVELAENTKPKLEFIPIHSIRFEIVNANLTDKQSQSELDETINRSIEAIRDYDPNESYVIRLILNGTTTLHKELWQDGQVSSLQQLRNEDQLINNPFIWIDSIDLNTRPVLNIDELKEGNDFVAEVLQNLEKYKNDEILDSTINILNEEISSPQFKRELKALTEEDKELIIEKIKWKLIDKLIIE